ncbi:hypothetical protein 2203_scaffold802_00003 [Bacteriophage sp.]|nr:hypothetical protein 2203_scaffold802_00003 [Bacteriophage sp.]
MITTASNTASTKRPRAIRRSLLNCWCCRLRVVVIELAFLSAFL